MEIIKEILALIYVMALGLAYATVWVSIVEDLKDDTLSITPHLWIVFNVLIVMGAIVWLFSKY